MHLFLELKGILLKAKGKLGIGFYVKEGDIPGARLFNEGIFNRTREVSLSRHEYGIVLRGRFIGFCCG